MSARKPGPPVDVGGVFVRDPKPALHVLEDVGDVFVRVRPTVVIAENAEGAVEVERAWYAGGALNADELAQIDRGLIEEATERAKAAEAEEAPGLSIEPGAMTSEQIEDALLAESDERRVLLGIRERLAAARERADERRRKT